MARAATTLDVFNAVAEGRRREILDVLARGERAVGELVEALGLAQAQVSKHLRVLREVDLVRVRRIGRRRLYSVNGARLRPVHDWAAQYERYWEHQLDRIKARAERDAAGDPGRMDHADE